MVVDLLQHPLNSRATAEAAGLQVKTPQMMAAEEEEALGDRVPVVVEAAIPMVEAPATAVTSVAAGTADLVDAEKRRRRRWRWRRWWQ